MSRDTSVNLRVAIIGIVALMAVAASSLWIVTRQNVAYATPNECGAAEKVVSYTPGPDLTGTPDPSKALGIEDGQTVSLGKKGEIVVQVAPPIADGPETDFRVWTVQEVPGNPDIEPDHVEVYVSADGAAWAKIGDKHNIRGDPPFKAFNIGPTGLSLVTYVKLIDGNKGAGAGTDTAGFDLDAVTVLNCGAAPENPAIDIEKLTNGEDADIPTGPVIPVGGPVNWTYIVTNTGDVALSNVSVTDNQGVAVSCPKTTLAVGESMTCTASGVATAGQYANVGTATGTSPGGQTVTDSDPSHYFGQLPPPANPSTGVTIEVVSVIQVLDGHKLGTKVTLEITEANDGDVSLSNPYVKLDPPGLVLTRASAEFTGGDTANTGVLDPGESWMWKVSHVITDNTTFTATGHGTAPNGNDVTWCSDPNSPPASTTCDQDERDSVTVKALGKEGCTPGYWKQAQHFDSWVKYSPTDDYETVFGVDASFTKTLLGALEQGGGGEKALGRHAVAALLNATSPDVAYPITEAQVIAIVKSAYETGKFELAKRGLEKLNQLGCPLN
jgi:hypothetical protein